MVGSYQRGWFWKVVEGISWWCGLLTLLTGMMAVMDILPRYWVGAVRAMAEMAGGWSHGDVGGEKILGRVYGWVELDFR